MKNSAYNLGLSDANLSKIELCERIKKYVPDFIYIEAEIGKDPDQRNYIVSNAKIEATGFKPQYSLDHGIQELIKGYQIVRHTEHTNFA
jgi:nucleoside-diphosphate-sugar epimerase